MPARYRRSYAPRRGRMARPRVIQVITNNTLTSSLTLGQNQGMDILAALSGQSINTDTGVTVLRTRLVITPNIAPTLNDNVIIGVGMLRNGDVGANVSGALTAATDYRWAYHEAFTMNGGLTRGGGNVITIHWRGRRVVRMDQDAWVCSIVSNFAAATQYHFYARSFVALP